MADTEPSMNKYGALTPSDVPKMFDSVQMQGFASKLKLPPTCVSQLGEDVRTSVLDYLSKRAGLSNDALRREIEALYRSADRKKYTELARAIENMSPATRHELERRRKSISEKDPGWRIPDPAELRNENTRERAAAGLKALMQVGRCRTEGRKRPNGKRSRDTWDPILHAPHPTRAEPRREAERDLIIHLQMDVTNAGGQVPRTGNREKVGPFVVFAAEVLKLVGAAGPHNNVSPTGMAVELLNSLQKRRRDRQERPSRFLIGTESPDDGAAIALYDGEQDATDVRLIMPGPLYVLFEKEGQRGVMTAETANLEPPAPSSPEPCRRLVRGVISHDRAKRQRPRGT